MTTTTPPIINCARHTYDLIPAMNQSSLKHMEKSPMHFYEYVQAPRKRPTDAKILGSLVDHILLGSEFPHISSPYPDYRTKEAREWRDKQRDDGVEVISAETQAKAVSMADSVRRLKCFKDWQPWRLNLCLQGVHEPTGIRMKGLLDIAPDNVLIVPDLKTTADASLWAFGASIATFGYDIQSAWYTELWRQNYQEDRDYINICVESEPPFATSVQMMPRDAVARAWRQCERWLETYAKCLESCKWPGYSEEVQFAQVPPWRLKDV
jgi:hypothetical protein